MKKLIIANWKMNPTSGSEARGLFEKIQKKAKHVEHVETVVCPPLIYIESLGEMVTDRLCVVGAQDAFWEHAGAYTGQVSPDMIFNAKARYVLVGHSERRAMGETDDVVREKIKSILMFPLIPVVCVGEYDRQGDDYVAFVKQQIAHACSGLDHEQVMRLVIAYEPVWAIGKQATRSCEPIECFEMVQIIRQTLADHLGSTQQAQTIPILYGGSVDDTNAKDYLDQGTADGLLIGRAGLDPEIFGRIIHQADRIAS